MTRDSIEKGPAGVGPVRKRKWAMTRLPDAIGKGEKRMDDQEFIRGKVPMTKEEVRAVCLAKLDLYRAKSFLDVGAGTGSVSLEAALAFPGLKVTAIEEKAEAQELIRQNQEKLGVKNLTLIEGRAPLALKEDYDSIFIGGSGGKLEAILDWSLAHLADHGRLVMTFILQENALQAQAWAEAKGLSLQMARVEVERLAKLGPGHYWKPENPILVLKMVAGEKAAGGKSADKTAAGKAADRVADGKVADKSTDKTADKTESQQSAAETADPQ
jgi:cobalt-precorrin-6B (C15)-methyltransferase